MAPKWMLDPNKALLAQQVAYTAGLPNTIADRLDGFDAKLDSMDEKLDAIKAKTDTIE